MDGSLLVFEEMDCIVFSVVQFHSNLVRFGECMNTAEALIEEVGMRGKLQHSVSHLTNQPCFWIKVFFYCRKSSSRPHTVCGV